MFAINQTKKISKNTVLFELNTGQKFVIGYSYSSMEKTDLGGGLLFGCISYTASQLEPRWCGALTSALPQLILSCRSEQMGHTLRLGLAGSSWGMGNFWVCVPLWSSLVHSMLPKQYTNFRFFSDS